MIVTIMLEIKNKILKKPRKINRLILYTLSILFWVAVWQIAAMSIGIDFILPSPISTLTKMGEIIIKPDFFASVGLSMLRVIFGFGMGAIAGSVIAMLGHFFSPVEVLFTPVLKIIRTTPVSSFILIAVLWIPSSIVPAFISFLMVLPIVYGNVMAGLNSTDIDLLEMCDMYDLSLTKKLFSLYFPTALPYFGAACMTSLGLAWKAGIAAEVLCVTKTSIGKYLQQSKLHMESAELFAWTLTVILVSVLLEAVIKLISVGVKKASRRRYGRN